MACPLCSNHQGDFDCFLFSSPFFSDWLCNIYLGNAENPIPWPGTGQPALFPRGHCVQSGAHGATGGCLMRKLCPESGKWQENPQERQKKDRQDPQPGIFLDGREVAKFLANFFYRLLPSTFDNDDIFFSRIFDGT